MRLFERDYVQLVIMTTSKLGKDAELVCRDTSCLELMSSV